MKCAEFREHWTPWREGWLAQQDRAMAEHRAVCGACARYDRQMGRLVSELATLPVPEGRNATARAREVRQQAGARRWWADVPRVAIVATLVIGVALGVLLTAMVGNESNDVVLAESVTISRPGNHEVALAFESPRALDEVEFTVELPPGVELAGFPGLRSVRWQAGLAEGRSRLTLPLRVAVDARDGKIVTRIRNQGKERRLVVPVEIVDPLSVVPRWQSPA